MKFIKVFIICMMSIVTLFHSEVFSAQEQSYLEAIMHHFGKNGWKVTKQKVYGERILVSLVDMKGWAGFQSTSFIYESIDDLSSVKWVNAKKQQTHKYVQDSRNMFGVRSGSKAAYVHGLEKYYLYYRCGNNILKFNDFIKNNYYLLIKQIESYCEK